MKKITTFLAAVALSCGLTSAQDYIYLVGQPTGWVEPSEANAENYADFRLYPDADGRYVGMFELGASNYFRFYSSLNGWDTDSFGPKENDDDNVEVQFTDDTYSSLLVSGKGSWCTPADFEAQNVLMTVDLAEKTVVFALNAEMPDLPDKPAEAVEKSFIFADNGYTDGQAVPMVMDDNLDITIFGATYSADTRSLNVPAETTIELCSRSEALGFKSIVLTFDEEAVFGDDVAVEVQKSFESVEPGEPMLSRADEGPDWSFRTVDNVCTWQAANADNLIVRFTSPTEVKIMKIDVRLEAPATDEPDEPDTPDNPDDAIDTVVADSNAAPEYFNLQGVRVANPANGQIVIERRGNTVTKRVF